MEKLYFSREDVKKIKDSDDELIKKITADVLKAAEKALEIEVLTEDKVAYSGEEGKYENQHENYYDASRPFMQKMLLLGFGYYYTDDEKYFEKARVLMLTYAGYKKWHGKGWHGKSELNNGLFCVGMAFGFSLFSYKLTEEEKKTIADATYRLGILPAFEDWVLPNTKIHALDTMGHNWWIVCLSSAALAATVMKDMTEDNARLIEVAAKTAKAWFEYKGNPINAKNVNIDNGGFYESVSYFDYALREYLQFRHAYVAEFGKAPFDDSELMEKAADYFTYCSYSSDVDDYFVHFGDTSGKGLMHAGQYILGEGFDFPALRKAVQGCTHREYDLFDLVFYNQIYKGSVKAPDKKSVCYDKIGWAIFRNGYDKNSTMLAVKCGDTWNHAHADAAHFEFYKNGVNEIYESGTCGYGEDEYLGYYVTSAAHNVVLFNGKGQDKRDFLTHSRIRGALYNFTSQEGFGYVAADATGPMGRFFRKHIRHFVVLDKFILIYDDIESYEPGEVSFLLHANEENSFRMMTECTVEKKKGYTDHNTESPVDYLSFTQKTDEACKAKFVSVILLDDSITPKMSQIENGYKLTCKDINVYINILSDGRIMHKNCTNTFDGYETDAVILVDCGGECSVVNGSIVRKDGKSILDTLARITGRCDLAEKDF